MPYLTVTLRNKLVGERPLLGNIVTIGRAGLTPDDSPDIVLKDETRVLSRYHAAFVRNGDGDFFIRDLGSTHFTYVNGELVFRRMLADNDEIKLGPFTMRFRTGDTRCNEIPGGLDLDDFDMVDGAVAPGTTLPRHRRSKTMHGAGSAPSHRPGGEILNYLTAVSNSSLQCDLLLEALCGYFGAEQGLIGNDEDGKVETLDSVGINQFMGDVIHLCRSDVERARENGHVVVRREDFLKSVVCISVPVKTNQHRLLILQRPLSNPFGDEDVHLLSAMREVLANSARSGRRAKADGKPSSSAHSCFSWKEWFVGSTPRMRQIRKEVMSSAGRGERLFLFGETGTGKEVAARLYHESSPRSTGKLVAIEVPSIPANLIETELFGSVKGAYSEAVDRAGYFEQAQGGTLFLDEIGDVDGSVQMKLRRAIEQETIMRVGDSVPRKIDFQLVAATNQEIRKEMDESTAFRQDLRWRIMETAVELPPLRKRRADIPLLVCYLIDKLGSETEGVSSAAMHKLVHSSWPGNVRQLKQLISQVSKDKKRVVFSFDLPDDIGFSDQSAPDSEELKTLDEMEKEYIAKVLKLTGNNKLRTAEILGRSVSTVYKKIDTYGLEPDGSD